MMRFLLLFLAGSVLLHQSTAITIPSGSPFDVRRTIPGFAYQGITFTPNGDLYMSSGQQFCEFTNAANLPIGGTINAGSGRCGTSNVAATNIVSTQSGRIYTVDGAEINKNTWQGTTAWNDCGATHGIALDPRDGAIFVSSFDNGKVWRIPNPDLRGSNPLAIDCDAALFFDGGAKGLGGFDGITIGPDGTFYGAGYSRNKFIVVHSNGTLKHAGATVNTSPDGISICVDDLGSSFALVAMTGGKISKFNLTQPGLYAESTIATNVGGYLDFTSVDPKGCIWGTTLFGGAQGVYRVTNADGSCGCASAQVPEAPTCPECLNPEVVIASRDGPNTFSTQGKCLTIKFQ